MSHYHADHFNRDIRRWEERAEAYIMHKNCWLTMDREEKKHLMVPGDTLTIGDLTVTMYGSTDEGGSFLVKSGEKTIFHAGDLNWWHWAGEPAADNLAARRDFFHELSRFSERQVDVAFFPVDARQQAAREWGVMAYLERVEPKLSSRCMLLASAGFPLMNFSGIIRNRSSGSPKRMEMSRRRSLSPGDL